MYKWSSFTTKTEGTEMENVKQRNLVQKHVMTFNRPTVFKDRKKEFKKGYTKHKVRFE